LLQEAHLALSQTEQMGGYFAKSWRYPGPNGTEIGVTTLSRVSPIQIRPLPTRHREFFITAPKLSLLTVYPLPEGKHLLAVNVHLLVFERFGTLKLRTQLAELEQAMQQHKGPIIMAGDFNTWSQKRLEIVKTVAQTLGLTEVDSFPVGRTTADKNSKFINWLYGVDKDLPIDRVFYRGYDSIYSGILPYRSSDHQAVVVQLSLRR
jgi:endonuclease/exonuclease/phosphatase (EEP) superfamily protein YafD